MSTHASDGGPTLLSLPPDFPRADWSLARLGMPPYMVGEYRFEVSWAARQASPHWATVMSASGGGVISAACFKLAIVDKALEVNATHTCNRVCLLRKPISFKQWMRETDEVLEDLYIILPSVSLTDVSVPGLSVLLTAWSSSDWSSASEQLPPGLPAPATFEDLYAFLRLAVNLWIPRFDIYDPPPRHSKDCAVFDIAELGPFAAKYSEHVHLVCIEDPAAGRKTTATTVVFSPSVIATPRSSVTDKAITPM
ncbi:uncharacterized protein EHS24_000143 [Apiotrichum porosum]|uniref:Uncharacterized protein n=1 Tax=Apiotrichum porosum TaxID=105984 RepID=A0A427Y938_9TREE|nr:uncharacterized protein EHS24_000143 [Apiotrichum porosum]RSH87631.1 hypothetical protein EHS24_000143 [Apiotrichum porosum]